jgi:hypothetical protein
VFILPVYLLLAAYGLRVVIGWLVSAFTRFKPRTALSVASTLATVLLLGLLAAISIHPVAAYYQEIKQNWRDATRLVCTQAEPGDQIFVRHVYHQAGVLCYISQWCNEPNAWTEANVRVFSRDLAGLLPPESNRQNWLIVPDRAGFLPGGELEASIQPHHHLLSPTIFRVTGRPEEYGIISHVTFQSVAVVPVMPSNPGSIRFWSDADTLTRGDCTWLRWQVDDVREVYLDGEGVVGHDQRQVCPTATTSYRLRVIRLDSTEAAETMEIQVNTP